MIEVEAHREIGDHQELDVIEVDPKEDIIVLDRGVEAEVGEEIIGIRRDHTVAHLIRVENEGARGVFQDEDIHEEEDLMIADLAVDHIKNRFQGNIHNEDPLQESDLENVVLTHLHRHHHHHLHHHPVQQAQVLAVILL